MIKSSFQPDVIAATLDAAALHRRCVGPLTDTFELDLRQAYAVQTQLVAHKLARGEHILGLKMGFTSDAMRRQMGVDRPNCGWLTSAMAIKSGSSLDLSAFIHPRIEPEVALLLQQDLLWPASEEDVMAAVGAVAPALEVVDSRFHDYRFRLEDNTADNSSAAAFMLGEWCAWPVDLGGLRVRLLIDGLLVEKGSSDSVLGHPLNSLQEAARLAAELGRPLRRNMVVLTGGLTSAHPIDRASQVAADMTTIGSVSLTLTNQHSHLAEAVVSTSPGHI